MTYSQFKIPILSPNSNPAPVDDPLYPNDSLLCKNYNDLIDALPTATDDLPEGQTNTFFTTSRARNSISVAGQADYDTTTGEIVVGDFRFNDTDFNTRARVQQILSQSKWRIICNTTTGDILPNPTLPTPWGLEIHSFSVDHEEGNTYLQGTTHHFKYFSILLGVNTISISTTIAFDQEFGAISDFLTSIEILLHYVDIDNYTYTKSLEIYFTNITSGVLGSSV